MHPARKDEQISARLTAVDSSWCNIQKPYNESQATPTSATVHHGQEPIDARRFIAPPWGCLTRIGQDCVTRTAPCDRVSKHHRPASRTRVRLVCPNLITWRLIDRSSERVPSPSQRPSLRSGQAFSARTRALAGGGFPRSRSRLDSLDV